MVVLSLIVALWQNSRLVLIAPLFASMLAAAIDFREDDNVPHMRAQGSSGTREKCLKSLNFWRLAVA